ncbi:MAG: N6-adenine-specific methylase [Armatimonadetes bacterium]|jgi:putative N6-adenine-specific DNA methylase|nr:N6-adenine-specific methylase [Armatimonadota bacterium]
MNLQRFFSPCPRGLEPVLVDELTGLGAVELETVPGGVHFRGDWATCYRANLQSRIATRVLWRVGYHRYRNEADVYRTAFDLPWPQWFGVRRTLRVYVTGVNCPLRSLDYLTVHIKDAVCARFTEQFGERPSVDTESPEVRVHAFLDEDTVTFYLDTSGEPLFKRGYRRTSTDAPLKENLAAGILRLTGWEPGTPLLDPMCGSGTFLLEAAQIALNIPPGHSRRFGFERLQVHQPQIWARVKQEALAKQLPPRPLPIYGSDLHNNELQAARRNLADAGLSDVVKLKQADVLRLAAPEDHGVLIANPPYGVRIGEQEKLAAFYPLLGDALKRSFSGWNCFFLSADPRLAKMIRLSPSRRIPLFNGSLECRLLEYRVVAGVMRKKTAGDDE